MEKRNEQEATHSVKFLRKRKFLLVLPVLVLPFLVMLVWTLGLVGDAKASAGSTEKMLSGLNMNLPSAVPGKDSSWNKMRYYEQAEKDSVKMRSLLKHDPYRSGELLQETADSLQFASLPNERSVFNPLPSNQRAKTTDQNEERVYSRIAALNKELEAAAERDRAPERERQRSSRYERDTTPAMRSGDVDRLERMMRTMNQPGEVDPEMTQLNQVLEKILDIQHPERAAEKVRQQSTDNKSRVYAVSAPSEDVASLLNARRDYADVLHELDSVPPSLRAVMTANRFYPLDEETTQANQSNAFAAVIQEDQTLVSGGTVRLRLVEEIMIAGVRIPKDHFVFAEAVLNGERLLLQVKSIQYRQHILPVSLTVYDRKDGIAGVRIPGAITREVAKRSAAQSAQSLGALNTLDPSVGAQLAGAGIQAAQQLVTKSAKLVQVSITAGYPVLLKDDNDKEK
jgi:conjugative transposon TraM protein